jgi:hypothetical protein
MESAFSFDFAPVRVYTGAAAHDAASALGARALTAGTDILFRAGEYQPGTPGGDRLLAHELAHVVQQAHGLPRGVLDTGATDHWEKAAGLAADHASPAAEREAHSAAMIAAVGKPVPALSGQPPTIARQDDLDDLGTNPPDGGTSPPDAGTSRTDTGIGKINLAPSCAEGCKEPCAPLAGEKTCDTKLLDAAKRAWSDAAKRLTTAQNKYDAAAPSPALLTSLKANFGWAPGDLPQDLPAQVGKNLGLANSKMSDFLCIKCPTSCPPTGVVFIAQARGQQCLAINCFMFCDQFPNVPARVHALLHELFHRVIPLRLQGADTQRGQSGYPGSPPIALGQPDSYASLIDDLA